MKQGLFESFLNKIYLLMILSFVSSPGLAEQSTRLVLSESAFQLAEHSIDYDFERLEKKNFKNAEDRKFYIHSQAKNDEFALRVAFENNILDRGTAKSKEAFESALADFKTRFPELLRRHLETTLAKFPHSSEQREDSSVVTIPRGLEFWVDLVLQDDPEKRVAGEVFLNRAYADDFGGFSAAFVKTMVGEFKQITRILSLDLFSNAEWQSVVRLAKKEGYTLARHGHYVLLGVGQSFLLTNRIFTDAEKLKDPILQKQFSEVAEHMAMKGIDIELSEHQGSAAFYSPLENKIAYVMPSRGDLDVYTHEGTHARFHQFEKALQRWTKLKNLAIPYEIDGPSGGMFASFGGFMNLLNELNSWRIGSSFSTPLTDRQILKILKDSYGRQAGKEAANLFGKVWTPEIVNGVSVPRLILRAVRALNKMSDEQAMVYGREALLHKDEVNQHNFIRLVSSRFKTKALPNQFLMMLIEFEHSGVTDSVRKTAQQWLESFQGQEGGVVLPEQRKLLREYKKKADGWLAGLKNETIKVIPMDYRFEFNVVLYYAAMNDIRDYTKLTQDLNSMFGDRVESYDAVKVVFAQILKEPGNTFFEKFISHLAVLNRTDFKTLWNQFLKEPSSDTVNMLMEHHVEKMKPAHLRKLFTMALDQSQSEEAQSRAGSLIEEIYDKNGFSTIYDVNDFSSLVKMQERSNQEAGRPLDAYKPVLRNPMPGQWLVDDSIDELLAAKMFDQRPGVYRLGLINFITSHTFPEELPKLRNRIVNIILNDSKRNNKNDIWVARMFLIPEKSMMFDPHILWHQGIAEAILKDPSPDATALEFVAEYYRLAVVKALPWSNEMARSKGHLTEIVRLEMQEKIEKMSKRDQSLVERARIDLWRLLGNENERVRLAARYALGTHPIFLLSIEDKIIAALKAKKSKYRQEVIHLLAFAKPGFLSSVDRYLADEKTQLRTGEKEILAVRELPDETLLNLNSARLPESSLRCRRALAIFPVGRGSL